MPDDYRVFHGVHWTRQYKGRTLYGEIDDAMRGNPQFWLEAATQVEEQALADTPSGDWRFGTLIVDEAQDFEGDWFETVRFFLRKGADILWLEDPNPFKVLTH